MQNSLKTGTLFILVASSALVIGCGTKPVEEGKVRAVQSSKIQKLNVDMDTEKRYQDAADKGYQPWKRDAVEVAKECLINTGTGASSGECQILLQDTSNAVVRVNTKDGTFKVSLKRLVKPDGIWTATEIEKEE